MTILPLRSTVISHVLRARMAGRLSGPLGFFREKEVVPEERPPAAQPPSPPADAVSDSSMRYFFRPSMSSLSVLSRSSEEVFRMCAKRSAVSVQSMWGLNLQTTFPTRLVLNGMHRHINPNRNTAHSIPVFLAIIRPCEAEALQEQVHPGEAGRTHLGVRPQGYLKISQDI